jgi:YggT family protein
MAGLSYAARRGATRSVLAALRSRKVEALNGGSMGSALLFLFHAVVQLIIFVVIASAILSWLIAFDVLNVRNRIVNQIWRGLDALTDPLLRPIRRVVPLLGGIDLSPVVLILLLQALTILVDRTVAAPLVGALR